MFAIEVLLLAYFAYVTSYALLLSLSGLFYASPVRNSSFSERFCRFAVFIPAYKEDAVIVSVAKTALTQNYPKDNFEIIVIADSLQPSTIVALKETGATVVEVSFEKSTKVKALNKAFESLRDNYDCAVVIDADNVMAEGFLMNLNKLFLSGYQVVQTQRQAKNKDNSLSLLDGMSETINNFIFRQGTVALGGCASLAGSGMMFPYSVLKHTLRKMDSVGGFDRELELKLMDLGLKVHYEKDIIIYDEKVSSNKVFQNQRKRWIYSQFFYLKKYFKSACLRLMKKGDVAYFNSAVLRNIQLPRLINLGLLSIIMVFSVSEPWNVSSFPYLWVFLWILFAVSMALAIPVKSYNLSLLKSVVLLPILFLKMTMLLFKLKGSNQTFIHTPHTYPAADQPRNE
jgi:cellulose synthase/poly-beta-1,6-N-acetylglucosamine synthase-like glycosyltransferase